MLDSFLFSTSAKYYDSGPSTDYYKLYIPDKIYSNIPSMANISILLFK